MRNMINSLGLYLAGVNLLAFAAFGWDKHLAKAGRWRIPETRLLLYAVLGGALGARLGMRCFRHKTQKPRFRILVPLLLAAQILLLLGLLFWTHRAEIGQFAQNVTGFIKNI